MQSNDEEYEFKRDENGFSYTRKDVEKNIYDIKDEKQDNKDNTKGMGISSFILGILSFIINIVFVYLTAATIVTMSLCNGFLKCVSTSNSNLEKNDTSMFVFWIIIYVVIVFLDIIGIILGITASKKRKDALSSCGITLNIIGLLIGFWFSIVNCLLCEAML